jgi:rsbT co-antagonist protein RsbR
MTDHEHDHDHGSSDARASCPATGLAGLAGTSGSQSNSSTVSAVDLERLRTITGQLVGPELYGPIIENLPDALVVIDEPGVIILVNHQAELLTGYHRSELLGSSVEMLIPEAARSRHVHHREGFVADPRSRPMGIDLPLVARHKSSREIPVRINLSPVVTSQGLFVAAIIRRKD